VGTAGHVVAGTRRPVEPVKLAILGDGGGQEFELDSPVHLVTESGPVELQLPHSVYTMTHSGRDGSPRLPPWADDIYDVPRAIRPVYTVKCTSRQGMTVRAHEQGYEFDDGHVMEEADHDFPEGNPLRLTQNESVTLSPGPGTGI